MTTPFLIPTTPKNQTFFISLNAVQYQLRLQWNPQAGSWNLDIGDQIGNPIAQGLALITGADLLEQLSYLGITGNLVVQTDNSPDTVPDFTTLGVTGQLYYISPNP